LIQHRIDLFVAGLEYDAGAGISLADSREAFVQYHSNLNPLCPIEVESLQGDYLDSEKAAGGVYAIAKDDSVRLFTLSSASRGIPLKEWNVPYPVAEPEDYCFHPDADVIAFIESPGSRCVPILWDQRCGLTLQQRPAN
jgi:hypothetical protein